VAMTEVLLPDVIGSGTAGNEPVNGAVRWSGSKRCADWWGLLSSGLA
jgi:hypothetical protein